MEEGSSYYGCKFTKLPMEGSTAYNRAMDKKENSDCSVTSRNPEAARPGRVNLA